MGEYRTKLKSTWAHDMLTQRRRCNGSQVLRHDSISRLASRERWRWADNNAWRCAVRQCCRSPPRPSIRIGPAIKLPFGQSLATYRPALQVRPDVEIAPLAGATPVFDRHESFRCDLSEAMPAESTDDASVIRGRREFHRLLCFIGWNGSGRVPHSICR
jgi:hypothetical protein